MTAKEISRARFDGLDRAIRDVRLSLGARVLYWNLDWYAREEGQCWPKIATLAAMVGLDIRSVQRWLGELREAGYVRMVAGRRGITYLLAWAGVTNVSSGVTPVSPHYLIDKTQQLNRYGRRPIFEPEQVPTPTEEQTRNALQWLAENDADATVRAEATARLEGVA